MMPRADLLEQVERVARKTLAYRYFLWDWGEAIATEGLLAAGTVTGEPEYYRWVSRCVDRWIERSPEPFWPDHVGPGLALIEYFLHSRQPGLLAYARALAAHLELLPRARTGARLHRPDKPDIARLVWVDSMQTDAPFLSALAQATGEARYHDQAAECLAGQVASLQDAETGLFHHAYSDESGRTNGVPWGRGNGWAALGLSGTLRRLPPAHPQWPWLAGRFRSQAEGLLVTQHPSGAWPGVLDRPGAPLEASTTVMLGHALALGAEIGILDDRARRAADLAWAYVGPAVDASGVVQGVSERTPPRPDRESYEMRPLGGFYPWGQGPWLLEACRRLAPLHGAPEDAFSGRGKPR
jgi:unsaturated rhamnogalacturonyl hydrolase